MATIDDYNYRKKMINSAKTSINSAISELNKSIEKYTTEGYKVAEGKSFDNGKIEEERDDLSTNILKKLDMLIEEYDEYIEELESEDTES